MLTVQLNYSFTWIFLKYGCNSFMLILHWLQVTTAINEHKSNTNNLTKTAVILYSFCVNLTLFLHLDFRRTLLKLHLYYTFYSTLNVAETILKLHKQCTINIVLVG